MKATKVKGLRPENPLDENAARIVAVRLAELRSFERDALERDEAEAQHNMRIAAKRLRYVLETVGFCFGDVADEGRRAARDLQDVLGDLHDCDVLIGMVQEPEAPTADRGIELLVAHTVKRRETLHGDFEALWAKLGRDDVWDRLDAAVSGRKRL